MLFGMPIGAAVGKLGTEQKPLVVPWILNRNGQAITLGEQASRQGRDERQGAADRWPWRAATRAARSSSA